MSEITDLLRTMTFDDLVRGLEITPATYELIATVRGLEVGRAILTTKMDLREQEEDLRNRAIRGLAYLTKSVALHTRCGCRRPEICDPSRHELLVPLRFDIRAFTSGTAADTRNVRSFRFRGRYADTGVRVFEEVE